MFTRFFQAPLIYDKHAQYHSSLNWMCSEEFVNRLSMVLWKRGGDRSVRMATTILDHLNSAAKTQEDKNMCKHYDMLVTVMKGVQANPHCLHDPIAFLRPMVFLNAMIDTGNATSEQKDFINSVYEKARQDMTASLFLNLDEVQKGQALDWVKIFIMTRQDGDALAEYETVKDYDVNAMSDHLAKNKEEQRYQAIALLALGKTLGRQLNDGVHGVRRMMCAQSKSWNDERMKQGPTMNREVAKIDIDIAKIAKHSLNDSLLGGKKNNPKE